MIKEKLTMAGYIVGSTAEKFLSLLVRVKHRYSARKYETPSLCS